MTTNADLEALLERATALEEKALVIDSADPDAEGLAEDVAELKAEAAELRETLDALTSHDEGRVEPWREDDEEQGRAELAAAGLDALEPAVEPEPEGAKSWYACTEHPEAEIDEFKDGTANCSECGTALADVDTEVKAEGVDFDDADADLDPEFKVDDDELETKVGDDTTTLSEMELLLARRARL